MSKVAIVFWSGTGNTEQMAEKVAQGVTAGGGSPERFGPGAFTPDLAEQFDAIAFGCPAMGAEELEEEEFAPMFQACLPRLKGKRLGLFGSYGWGDGEWMRTWEETCAQAGAVLAAGSVICQEAPDADAESACEALGKTLARF